MQRWLLCVVLLWGCAPPTIYEACTQLYDSFCECGDDPYRGGETAEAACRTEEEVHDICNRHEEGYNPSVNGLSVEEYAEVEACHADVYADTCDYDTAGAECGSFTAD